MKWVAAGVLLIVLSSCCAGQSGSYATYRDDYLNFSFEYPSEMVQVQNTSDAALLVLKGSDYALFLTGGGTNLSLERLKTNSSIGNRFNTASGNNAALDYQEIKGINGRQWLIERYSVNDSSPGDLIGYFTICSPVNDTYPENMAYSFGLMIPFGRGSDSKYTAIMDHLAETFTCS